MKKQRIQFKSARRLLIGMIALFVLPLHALGQTVGSANDVVEKQNCFLVSGAQKDPNGAFSFLAKAEPTGKISFYGHDCKIFNSYRDLNTYVRNLGLPENAPILVIQEGHGTGGGANLNGGWMEPGQILSALRDLTKHYRVAFIGSSCYSGNLLSEKLIWDAAHETSPADAPAIDRLCMWADSLPGRISFAFALDQKPLPNATFEELYQTNPQGVLSSAAWSESGFVDYMKNRRVPTYLLKTPAMAKILNPISVQIMKVMTQVILEGGGNLPPSLKKYITSAQFVLNPETSDAEVFSLMAKLLSDQNSITGGALVKIQETLTRETSPNETGSCKSSVQALLRFSFLNQGRSGNYSWKTVIDTLSDSAKGKIVPELASARPALSQPYEVCSGLQENHTPIDWANWLSQYSALGNLMMPYAKTQDQISTSFQSSLSADELLNQLSQVNQALLNDSNYSQTVLTQKSKTFNSFIGTSVFNLETTPQNFGAGLIQEPTGFEGAPGATGNVLPAFTLASNALPDFSNSLDQRRRMACRSIRINPQANAEIPVVQPNQPVLSEPVVSPEPEVSPTPEAPVPVTPDVFVGPEADVNSAAVVVASPTPAIQEVTPVTSETATPSGGFGRFFKRLKSVAASLITIPTN